MEDIPKEIERYHDCEMSAEEAAAFEARIAADPSLREEVERDAVSRNVAEALAVMQLRNRVAQIAAHRNLGRPRRNAYMAIGIAAGVALLCLVGWVFLGGKPASPRELAKEYATKWELETSSLLGPEEELLKKARIDYQSGRYRQAIENAGAVTCRDGSDSATVGTLMGYAYMQLGDFAHAKMEFDQAILIASDWDDEVHWGSGVSALALGKYDEAIGDLDWLLNDDLKTPQGLKALAKELKIKAKPLLGP